MIQSMWDRGEPNGYANHMTTNPLPGTPAHKVLIEMAYGDHQVANVATEVEASTIGAPLRYPALDPGCPPASSTSSEIPALGDLPGPPPTAVGSSSGTSARSGRGGFLGTDPPPITNTAPDDSFGVDPHDTVIHLGARGAGADRRVPEDRRHDHRSLRPGPCYAAGWLGPP